MPRCSAAALACCLLLLAALAGITFWQSNTAAAENIDGSPEPLWQWVDTDNGNIEYSINCNITANSGNCTANEWDLDGDVINHSIGSGSLNVTFNEYNPPYNLNFSALKTEVDFTAADYWGPGTTSGYKAQTFTPSESFMITGVSLELARSGDIGDMTVEIRSTNASGYPTETVLTSNTTTMPDDTVHWKYFSFPGYSLSDGETYAITITADNLSFMTPCFYWHYDNDGAYGGGMRFSSSDGSSWTSYSGEDFVFKAFGSGSSTYMDVSLGGWNASEKYNVTVDGATYTTVTAYDGIVSFNYTGGWSSHTFEIISTGEMNQPPSITNPSPSNGTTGVEPEPTLNVDISDLESDDMTLQFRTNDTGDESWVNLTVESTGLSNGTYNVGTSGTGYYQDYNTKYWWRALSRDPNGSNSTTIKTFHFTTRGAFEPSQPENFTLDSWNVSSIALYWDMVGSNTDKTVIVRKTGGYPSSPSDGTEVFNTTDTGAWKWDNGLSINTTYYYAAYGYNTTDNEYSSGAAQQNTSTYPPPNKPKEPYPADNATDQELSITFQWNGTDPNDGNMTYDFYIDTSTPLTTSDIAAHNLTTQYYNPGGLSTSTTYYWKVVAWSEYDGHNSSDTWNLTTRASPPSDSIKNLNTSTWYQYLANATWQATTDDVLAVYGNYSIDEKVTVNKSLNVEGQAANISVDEFDLESTDIYLSNMTVEQELSVDYDNCSFYNLSFNRTNGQCIQISSDINNIHIDNCTFLQNGDPSSVYIGIWIGPNNDHVYIENCTFILTSSIDETYYGIYLYDWFVNEDNEYIYIKNNSFTGPTEYSIYLYASAGNWVRHGSIENNTFHTNISTGSNYNVRLHRLDDYTVKNNNITSSIGGLELKYSNDTLIYNNIFNASLSNTNTDSISNITWNITKTAGANIIGGPYRGGNHWSDYTGTDGDGDGIGDSSYTIATGETDYLPLVEYNYEPNITHQGPVDGGTDISRSPTLNVSISDQNNDDVTVCFYNATNDGLIGTSTVTDGSGYATTSWGTLAYGTTYNWYVTANDSTTNVTSTTWSFTTVEYNNPPTINLSKPPNGWTSVHTEPDLTFTINDAEGDGIWTEVYAKQSGGSWSQLSASNLTNGTWTVSYTDANSLNTKYYWHVNVTNDNNTWTNSSIWNFTTRALNEPSPPYNATVTPYNATQMAYWYDIGQGADKTVIVRNNSSQPTSSTDGIVIYNDTDPGGSWSYDTGLSPNSTYYYAFYSYNETGGISDDAWTYNASTYLLPEAPHTPDPANETANFNRTDVNISWSCSDPDVNGFAIDHYNIYLGTSNPPSYIANTNNTYYDVGNLNYGTTYYWYIEAVNNKSDKNSSEVWQFTTESADLPSPPSSFDASHGGYYWLNVSWTPDSGADKTYIRYDTTNHTDWTRTDGNQLCNISGSYKQHTGLDKHTTYYYAAWSWNAEGYSSSYVSTSGSVNNRNPSISSVSPADGASQVTIYPTLSFYVDDDDDDNLTVSLQGEFMKTWTDVSPGQTLTYEPGPLNGGERYRWSIAVVDDYGGYTDIDYRDFTTNNPPSFSSPFPSDGATGVPVNISELSAYISDGDGDTFDWQIWMYTSPPYGYSANGSAETNGTKDCAITSDLNYSTTYTWYINTTDGIDYSNISYQFTTESYNHAPSISERSPSDGASVHTPALLEAKITDQDGDVVNVTFQKKEDGSYSALNAWNNVAVNQTFNYSWSGLSTGVTYTWRVVFDDGVNNETSADWTFTITATNYPPNEPSNPSPSNGNSSVGHNPTLNWTCSDPDGDTVSYDVYFGTDPSPDAGEKVSSNQSGTTYTPGTLNPSTTYYWQIVAWDTNDASNTSSIWSFTTTANNPPNISSPSPANGSVNQSTTVNLGWNCTDPDGDTVTYTVYFGTTTSPSLVSVNQSGKIYNPGVLTANTTYYWRVVAYDSLGASNTSDLWHFNTSTPANYSYNIYVRYESNFSLVSIPQVNTSYNLTAYWYKDEEKTEKYNVSTNPYGVNFDTKPDVLRLYVNDTYYRSVIPENTTNISMFIVQNASDLAGYTITLDDMSGNYKPPDAYITIYVYNGTTKGVIHEDYFTADKTQFAYLIQNDKYYVDISTTDQTTAGYTLEADMDTDKTVTITPQDQYVMQPIWNVVEYNFTRNGSKVSFVYSDVRSNTEWANITIYEVYNNTKTSIYSHNYTGINSFNINLLNRNSSRTYIAAFSVSHGSLDETRSTSITIMRDVSALGNYQWINSILTIHLGLPPVSTWVGIIAFFLIMFAMFAVGPSHPELSVIAGGFIMAAVTWATGFPLFNLVLTGTVFLIGFLLALNNKGGEQI